MAGSLRAAMVALVGGAACALVPSYARALPAASARAPACEGPLIRSELPTSRAGARMIADFAKYLAESSTVDPCGEIALSEDGGRVVVRAQLGDGRVAVRVVGSMTSALATAEALLTILPGEPVASAPPPVLLAAPPAPTAGPEQPPPAPKGTSLSAFPLGMDVGFAPSVRVGSGRGAWGYGVVAHLDAVLDGWLLGAWIRWDVRDYYSASTRVRGLTASSFALGAFGGRRFVLGGFALDLIAGPNLVVENEESLSDGPDDVGGEIGGVAIHTGLRGLFPHRGNPAGYVLCSGELFPHRLHHQVQADASLPVLSAWTMTSAVGITWSPL